MSSSCISASFVLPPIAVRLESIGREGLTPIEGLIPCSARRLAYAATRASRIAALASTLLAARSRRRRWEVSPGCVCVTTVSAPGSAPSASEAASSSAAAAASSSASTRDSAAAIAASNRPSASPPPSASTLLRSSALSFSHASRTAASSLEGWNGTVLSVPHVLKCDSCES